MHKVSFFTPAFQSAGTIAASVASIRRQTYKPWELISAHDGGDESAWDAAEAAGVHVLRKHDGQNLGLAASCNTALRYCTGEFLAKVDSDVELDKHWLAKCMAHFRDDRVAGVGGRLVETYSQSLAGKWRSIFMRQHWGINASVNPEFLFGADAIFRVDVLKTIGGWNQRYRTNFEDVDLSVKIKKAGYLLAYEPKAVARHMRQDTLAGVMSNFWRWYKDAPEDAGLYNSVEGTASLIGQHCFKTTQQMAQASIFGENPDLVYPSMLLFFWLCLSDLEYLGVKGLLPEEAVKATQAAVVQAVASRQTMPEFLRASLLADLRNKWSDVPNGWQPDPTYMAHFVGCFGALEFGPFSTWALETSLKGKEENLLARVV